MEVDNEVSGNGNSYTTEFRQYDPRLGRWKSLDPLMMEFPDISPYVGFSNNPIVFVDPLGLASESPQKDEKPKRGIVYGTRFGRKVKNWIRVHVRALVSKEFRRKLKTVKNDKSKITILHQENGEKRLKDGGNIVASEVEGIDLWKFSGPGGSEDSEDEVTDDKSNEINLDPIDITSDKDYIIKKRIFQTKHKKYKKKKKRKKSSLNKLKWGFSQILEGSGFNKIHWFSFGFGNNFRTNGIFFHKRFTGPIKYNHNSVTPLLGIKWKTRKGVVNWVYIGTAIRLKHGNELSLVGDLTRRSRRRRKRKKNG